MRETRISSSRRPPLLVRAPGQRCDFCGRLTSTAAVAVGREPAGTVICPSCVDKAAQQLFRPGGGDAA
ncbi:MAG: hypothetical protein WA751_08020 [Candidatus Dormiibacterota bacterium]